MPYVNEHACRLRQPNLFSEGTIRRMSRSHKGKVYDVIYGKIDGKSKDQAFRYNINVWTEGEARRHCSSHKGIMFEKATGHAKKSFLFYKT